MRFVYLGLFIVITTLHLIGTAKNDRLYRSTTKGLILIFILGFYLESTSNPSWLIVAALLFSWAGDMFLIPNGVKWFTIGGIGFLISHLFFIMGYSETFSFNGVNPIIAVSIALVYVIATVISFSKLKAHLPKPLFIPMFFYLLINGAMNCFAWYRLMAGPSLGTIITAIGALLFYVSDTSLFFVRFNKETKQKSHFLVMVTYSLGEFLIILGLVL